MKYIAVLDTNDYEDFDFFEDGKEKYLHAVDANAENGEWIYLPFRPVEQELKPMVEIDLYSDGYEKALEDIRAEIDAECGSKQWDDYDYCSGLITAKRIIDKYKGKSEDKE